MVGFGLRLNKSIIAILDVPCFRYWEQTVTKNYYGITYSLYALVTYETPKTPFKQLN